MKAWNKKYVLPCAASAALLFAVGWHGYRNFARYKYPGALPYERAEPGRKSGQADSAPKPSVGVGIQGQGAYTVEQVPISAGAGQITAPSLDRSVVLVFPASFPENARTIIAGQINDSIAALKKEPRDFGIWMDLAILRKTIDDYEGAAEIWKFLTAASPGQPSPFSNLANLYAFHLKDPALAEKYFTLALEKGPKDVSVYRSAYEFYRYVRKDHAAAKTMLTKGTAETSSPDLQYLLNHYSEL